MWEYDVSVKRHDIAFPPAANQLDVAAGLFRAMADPTRLLLMVALLPAELSVGELVEMCGRPQSTVSRQLAVLRQAGLLTARRDGAHVHYRLTNIHVADMLTQALGHAEHLAGNLPHDHASE